MPLCGICQNDLNDHPCESLSCSHTYHSLCIQEWCRVQQMSIGQVKCPECKNTSGDLASAERRVTTGDSLDDQLRAEPAPIRIDLSLDTQEETHIIPEVPQVPEEASAGICAVVTVFDPQASAPGPQRVARGPFSFDRGSQEPAALALAPDASAPATSGEAQEAAAPATAPPPAGEAQEPETTPAEAATPEDAAGNLSTAAAVQAAAFPPAAGENVEQTQLVVQADTEEQCVS